jgi:hypothetical protein
VVYADIDPMVAAQAGGLLTGDASTRLVTADLRDPGQMLGDPGLREMIDFAEPAGLLMTAVLHFVADTADPWGLVARYLEALAPGSYLALSHGTSDRLPPAMVSAARELYDQATEQVYPRSLAGVQRFFAGLELAEPYPGAGPVLCHTGEWGAEDPASADSDGSRIMYCGVARRP